LNFNGPGPVIVRALQDGNEIFQAAPPVAHILVFQKSNQTIELNERSASASALSVHASFGSRLTALSTDNSRDLVYLQPRASSRLPISLQVVSGPGHLLDKILVIDGNGVVVVRATQSGDEMYNPAVTEKAFGVSKQVQTIAFADLPPLHV